MRADGLAASIGWNSTLLAVPESTRNYGTRDKQKIPRDKIATYFGMCRILTPEITSGEQVFEESTTWEGSLMSF